LHIIAWRARLPTPRMPLSENRSPPSIEKFIINASVPTLVHQRYAVPGVSSTREEKENHSHHGMQREEPRVQLPRETNSGDLQTVRRGQLIQPYQGRGRVTIGRRRAVISEQLYCVGLAALGLIERAGSSACELRDEVFVFRAARRAEGCLRARAPEVMELLPFPRDMTQAGSASSECIEANA
jgi:hypothetical protein